MGPVKAALALLAMTSIANAQTEAPRYGDEGTSEVSLLLGFSSSGFAAGGGYRYFVANGVAPGLEATIQRTSGITQGFTFASLRVVPLRLASVAFVLTGRAGRVYLSRHADGWAVGGDAGVLFSFSRNVGLEVGYEVLRLLPGSFCADLESCTLHQPVLGLRLTF
jgi:hypothetical protein